MCTSFLQSESVAPNFKPSICVSLPWITYFDAIPNMEELTCLEALCKGYKFHATCVCNKVDKIFTQESLDEVTAAYLPISIEQFNRPRS